MFRASLRRKFYNREGNKPKATSPATSRLPRNKFEFFEQEAKVIKKGGTRKRDSRNPDEEDMFSDEDNATAPPAKKVKRKKETSQSTKTRQMSKKDVATEEAPAVTEPGEGNVIVIPSDGNEVAITGEEAAVMDSLGDIIFADPTLLDGYNVATKQVIYSQVNDLANHLQAGGDCGTFSGWRCEHGTIPTNVQMAIEDQSLGLPFNFLSLFVPADLPAVQRIYDNVATNNPLRPPPDAVAMQLEAAKLATVLDGIGQTLDDGTVDDAAAETGDEVRGQAEKKGDADAEEDAGDDDDAEEDARDGDEQEEEASGGDAKDEGDDDDGEEEIEEGGDGTDASEEETED